MTQRICVLFNGIISNIKTIENKNDILNNLMLSLNLLDQICTVPDSIKFWLLVHITKNTRKKLLILDNNFFKNKKSKYYLL